MSSVGDLCYANQDLRDTMVKRIRCQNGSEKLDLSLCNIRKIPLQLINDNYYGQPRELDLSFNAIRFISPKFTLDMIYLTKLDLSNNQIRKLPDNFGAMHELVYLDLHHNKLETLPVSMGQMHRLSFLSISRNPLRPPLRDFLGHKEPGISPIVMAGLVVQFLQELGTVHTPDSAVPIPEGNRRNSVHYHGRMSPVASDGDSSDTSINTNTEVDANNNPYDLEVDSPFAQREAFAKALFFFLRFLAVLAIWMVLIPLAVAYVAETPYLEYVVAKHPEYATVWSYYKPIHETFVPIAAWIPKTRLMTLKGPSQQSQPESLTYARKVAIWLGIVS